MIFLLCMTQLILHFGLITVWPLPSAKMHLQTKNSKIYIEWQTKGQHFRAFNSVIIIFQTIHLLILLFLVRSPFPFNEVVRRLMTTHHPVRPPAASSRTCVAAKSSRMQSIDLFFGLFLGSLLGASNSREMQS